MGAGECPLNEAVTCEEPTLELLAGTTVHGEKPTLEQVYWQTCDPIGNPNQSSLFLKDYTLWKGPMPEQFLKNCSPVGRTNIGEINERLSPMDDTP